VGHELVARDQSELENVMSSLPTIVNALGPIAFVILVDGSTNGSV
jgi:hypothetical protein